MRPAVRIALLTLLCLPLRAEVAQFEIAPRPASHFALEVEKTGLLAGKKHHFEFSRYHGQLQYDKEHPLSGKLRLTVESASLACQDTWVKAKDIGKIERYAREEMLASDRYGEIVFESSSLEQSTSKHFLVTGQLTIRDRAKPVSVDVTLEEVGDRSLRFVGRSIVRLSDYGLKAPSAGLGTIGTKDEMAVLFDLTAISR